MLGYSSILPLQLDDLLWGAYLLESSLFVYEPLYPSAGLTLMVVWNVFILFKLLLKNQTNGALVGHTQLHHGNI